VPEFLQLCDLFKIQAFGNLREMVRWIATKNGGKRCQN
jgi:hypothetical protein